MDTIGPRRRSGIGIVVAALAASLALLAVGAGTAAASPSALNESTSTCWNDVINDWLVNDPNVVGTYPYACYTQAIQHLNSYKDVQGYSNAADDIRRALLAALHNNGGASGGPGGTPTSGPSTSGGGSNGGGPAPPSSGKSFITQMFDAVGPGNAQSVPLPLLVLAGLAVLLLLAAGGTWLAKRIQSRRMTPSPAPARRH